MPDTPAIVDDGPIVTLNSGRVIAYRPEIAKYFDDQPNVAIYFQQLYHWQEFATKPDKYFYKSAKEMYEETGISAKRQRKCRETLEEYGWITTKKEMANGHPTLHFKVLIKLNTVVALGEKTNGNSQKDKSITRDDNKILKYTSEIEKVYEIWLKLIVVDPAVRLHGTPDDRRAALLAARKHTRLTDKRKTKIASRIESMGVERVIEAVKNISRSDFHNARGEYDVEGAWSASLEWLCNSDEKIEEWANKGERR